MFNFPTENTMIRFFYRLSGAALCLAVMVCCLSTGPRASTVEDRKWLEGPKQGEVPWIKDLLPSAGLDRDSLHYLNDHLVLNHLYPFADENILGLGKDTPSVLATYRRPAGEALLLMVSYPMASVADHALEALMHHYLPEASPGVPMRLEDRTWAGALVYENILSFILKADSEDLARELLDETTGFR